MGHFYDPFLHSDAYWWGVEERPEDGQEETGEEDGQAGDPDGGPGGEGAVRPEGAGEDPPPGG